MKTSKGNARATAAKALRKAARSITAKSPQDFVELASGNWLVYYYPFKPFTGPVDEVVAQYKKLEGLCLKGGNKLFDAIRAKFGEFKNFPNAIITYGGTPGYAIRMEGDFLIRLTDDEIEEVAAICRRLGIVFNKR